MRLVFDLEADGFLNECTQIFILTAFDLDTKTMLSFTDNSWIEYFSKADELIGHHIIGYDLLVMKKLHDFEFKGKITDTLLMSQIENYNREGGHSLESWGKSLGHKKGDYKDFSRLTDEMVTYNINDVKLNIKVYEYLEPRIEEQNLKQYLEVETAVAKFCALASYYGWEFDKSKAIILRDELESRANSIYRDLNDQLGIRVVKKDSKNGVVDIKYPKWTKVGFYDQHLANWFNIDPCSGYEGEERMVEGPFCRVEFKKMELSSANDVKLFLYRKGWKPTQWNFTKDENGRKKRSSPKITEDSLEFLEGGELYKEYLTIRSRYGIVNTWIENCKEGKVHGECFTIGTPSMRVRHAIIVNVPTEGKLFGHELRELFTCKPGWKLIGADSSGNQARGLAHYLKNPEYTRILLEEDIHVFNANILTNVLKESLNIEKKVPRDIAKRVLYAALFGASGSKLWTYIFEKTDQKKGAVLKKGFLEAVPGFSDLLKKLEKAYERNASGRFSFFRGIAGNKIYVDSPHKLLVYLLQCVEKATCGASLMVCVKNLEENNIPYIPCIFMHDEIQFMVPEENAEQAAVIAKSAFKEGPKLFGIDIMDGEAKIGDNWSMTH